MGDEFAGVCERGDGAYSLVVLFLGGEGEGEEWVWGVRRVGFVHLDLPGVFFCFESCLASVCTYILTIVSSLQMTAANTYQECIERTTLA